MYLLIGGDSELGAATWSYFKQNGDAIQATTRRRDRVSSERPFFDILHSLEQWQPPENADAACIFLSVPRLRDCATDPVGSALVNCVQAVRLIDKLIAHGIYVLFLSSNQVYDGEIPNVPADASTCPISEYGRQKVRTEAAIQERIAKGARVGILRLSKILSPGMELMRQWIDCLSSGNSVAAFHDMTVAPVPVDLASAAVAALLRDKLPGIFQLTGPRDVTYADVARHFAMELHANPGLVEPISAYTTGMPEGATPRHTTLDSTLLRKRYSIAAPDVWEAFSPILDFGKANFARAPKASGGGGAVDDLLKLS